LQPTQKAARTPKDFRPCTLLGAVNMEIGLTIWGILGMEKLLNEVIAKSQWMMSCEAFLCVPKNPRKKPYVAICSRGTPAVIVGRKRSMTTGEQFVADLQQSWKNQGT
jgi:hypothetical protein